MLRVYKELGHETDFQLNIKALEDELEELRSSPRYNWVRMYKAGDIETVKNEFLKFLLNEIYIMETKNGL